MDNRARRLHTNRNVTTYQSQLVLGSGCWVGLLFLVLLKCLTLSAAKKLVQKKILASRQMKWSRMRLEAMTAVLRMVMTAVLKMTMTAAEGVVVVVEEEEEELERQYYRQIHLHLQQLTSPSPQRWL
jgi:hypothetical protein